MTVTVAIDFFIGSPYDSRVRRRTEGLNGNRMGAKGDG
jgi:hypothetical protein